ncbi:hypothetical protein P7K49_021088 [Saguinus oedipus]|uniref:Uncharacterized protein n=1 Tax=Saguinus oedipus TaxID=9490 RepID=A0ABQ9URN4_SAGOE|nr:hypothetical protein P7K49_021088 [Saguinus oedipus]
MRKRKNLGVEDEKTGELREGGSWHVDRPDEVQEWLPNGCGQLKLCAKQVAGPEEGEKPTTGLLAITLALHLCDLVHIAGFGYPDAYNKKQTIHYYEQITLKSMAGSGHNVSQEALAIKRMLEMGAVKNLTSF